MKLLLTSGGIATTSIANSLDTLTGKKRDEVKITFIPTAANVEEGNKDWFLKQLTDLTLFGFTYVDIVDISAKDVDWRSRLMNSDVVYIGGGNTFHLLNQIRVTDFDKWLVENKNTKVIVGGSAGSIIFTPTIAIAGVEPGDINLPGIKDLTGLRFVNFEISPHTPNMISYEINEEYSKTTSNQLYSLDDTSAIEVVDDQVKIISEGQWKKLK